MAGQSAAYSQGPRSGDQLTSKRHVQELESPAEERQVAGCEDKANDTGVGNGGRTGLFPLYRRRSVIRGSHRGSRVNSRSRGCTAESGSLYNQGQPFNPSLHIPLVGSQHVRVKGCPLLVVVEGVTRAFLRSRSSPLVLVASVLMLSTTGPMESN